MNIFSKRRKLFYAVFYIASVLFLVGGFSYLNYRKNHMPVITVVQTGDSANFVNEDMYMTMPIGKGWFDNGYHANQYDATLYNNTSHNLTDWTVTLTLPARSRINDKWNIDVHENEDGSITIVNTPDQGYNDYIEPNGFITFGFILFSNDDSEITDFKLTARPDMKLKNFALFPILCGYSLIVVIFVCTNIATFISTRRYKERRERDKKIIVQSMKTFSNFIDEKDPYTKGHSARVAYYTRKMSQKLDFSEEEIDNIYYIALLHDVGKIYIPDEILNKPGKLTPEEMDVIKTHTLKGAGILKDFSTIPGIMDGAKYHHEKYDGSGYPEGLSGEDIPLISRIIGVADSYDAMNSDRCYRKALSSEKIRAELTSNAGHQFDPKIVEIMLSLIDSNAFDDLSQDLKN